jgi:hypothetical protein
VCRVENGKQKGYDIDFSKLIANAPYDKLNGKGATFPYHRNRGMRRFYKMIPDDIARLFKPKDGAQIEHGSLIRYHTEVAIKSRLAIRRPEHQNG